MSVSAKKIVEFCSNHLHTKKFHDYCYNGLQIQGASEVSRIVTGVSLSQKLIDAAIADHAQMIMVHHGLFGNQLGNPPRIVGVHRERIKRLLVHDISLCGYHLPLDCHLEIGNNISILRQLKLTFQQPLLDPSVGTIGVVGTYNTRMLFSDFLAIIKNTLSPNPFIISAGNKWVQRVGIISGGSSVLYPLALTSNVDTFICGDIRENIVREIEETQINFINAGHYNTEILGIKNLGNLVGQTFHIPVTFIDVPCDV